MNFLKKTLICLLMKKKRKQFSHSSICDASTQIDWIASCQNETGHKENISIGSDCWIRGTLSVIADGRITIGNRTYIGGGTRIGALQKIEIGNDVIIANDVHIYDNNNHPVEPEKRMQMTKAKDYSGHLWDWNEHVARKDITICDNVWIGERSAILKGVVIGKGAVVGCNSVVTHDVPEYCIVVGNPAKIVKKIQ